MLSHPEPLLKAFLFHKVRALSSCHMNLAYWAGAEMGSDQRWPGGVLQSQVVIQEDCRSQDVLGLHFFITALDPSDGNSWVKKKNLNCQSGRWRGC